MSKAIRTIVVSLLAFTLLGGSALADPKDKQPPGQDKKAERQDAKEERKEAKAAEKEAKAAEKADETNGAPAQGPKKAKKAKKAKKDVIPGNNGTIKIDGEPFDLSHGNEPHVGCVFRVNFFNFDEATKTSTLTFEGHAPSGGGVFLVDAVTFSGSDSSSPVYSLSSFDQSALAAATAHPKQGYHVRVTTSTPFANGNDTKSKVFWIDCTSTESAATAPRAPGARDVGSIELAPMQPDSSDEADAQVLGTRITPPQAAEPAEAQGTQIFGLALPFTGQSVIIFLIAGLALVVVGAAVTIRGRA